MQEFCESESCRRQYLLQYFGEAFPAYCGSCDFCLSNLEEKDATVDAQKLLSAISRTGERYGTNYIIDFLRGSASEKIVPAHKELKTYGIGKHLKKEEWQWMIKMMLQQKMMEKTDDPYATLQLNAKSWEILKTAIQVKLVMKKETAAIADEEKPEYEQELFKQLRSIRLDMADREHVPAYAIVADNSLVEMATYLPQTFGDLLSISGFGDYKVGRYGALFLSIIKAYCEAHKLTSRMPVRAPKKEKRPKAIVPSGPSLTIQQTFGMFKDGLGISEIAEQRHLSQQTIENHLAVFIANGELNINKLVPQNKLDKIMEVIKATGQINALKPLKDLLGDEFTYGEIRLGLEYYKSWNGN
jgi:ATP-dependent DNA helicase RecQ